MNRMKCGFYTYRGIAFCFVAAMFCGQTMAQVVEKRGFDSQKKINAFDNTTFCTAYLSDGADRKSTRLNSSHITRSRMPSSA